MCRAGWFYLKLGLRLTLRRNNIVSECGQRGLSSFSPHVFWHWWRHGIWGLEGGGVLYMSWCCHWRRQCKAGAYRKNGCDDSLLLTLCCDFLGLFFNCSVLYPRPPWPISCTTCSQWCFRADNIGAETLLPSLNCGGLLEENCSASFISALSFLSSFLGCELFFVVGLKPRTSTHSCQVWQSY